MASKLPLLLVLVAVTCLSQFYRVSNGVIAPELTRDLDLTPRQLGWAGSAYFFALFAAQVPVGLWFDRFGARRTVSALSLLAVAGALVIAAAQSATGLIVGRTVVGIGCAASFMSVVFLCSRWFASRELATALSWVFAASNIGTLAAATPLAWIAATVGWRSGFVGLGALTVVVAAAFWAIARDRPPGALRFLIAPLRIFATRATVPRPGTAGRSRKPGSPQCSPKPIRRHCSYFVLDFRQ